MSASALRRGRHAASRRPRWVWISVIALAATVLSCIAASGGTYALWNAAASTTASHVSSGTAALTVGSLSSMNTKQLGPGSSVTGTFTATNGGSVPLSMRVTTTSTSVSSASGASNATVLGALSIHFSMVSSAAACTPGLAGAVGALATFDGTDDDFTLSPGTAGVGCIEVELAANAPQTVSGAVTSFALTATGTQVLS